MSLLKAAGTPLPLTDPIACEICGEAVALTQAHSIAVSYNMPGANAQGITYPAYQCSQLQHYACTHEHAVAAAIACLFEHVEQGNNSAKSKDYDGGFKQIKKFLEQYSVVKGAGGV